MFRRLHGREPREEDAADLSELRVIRLYEDRVEEQRSEIDFLRKEVAEANILLKQTPGGGREGGRGQHTEEGVS